MIVIGAGVVYSGMRYLDSSKPVSDKQPTQTTENKATSRGDGFSAKLAACSPSSTSFKHPFTGEDMTRTIKGMVDGKCEFVETMPNNGAMTCRLDTSQQANAAKYYETIENAHQISGSLDGATTVDGQPVENVLSTLMDQKACTISGYEAS